MKILLKTNKSLVLTRNQRIYQRESLTNIFDIYIPKELGDYDLSLFTATLKWVDAGNIVHLEILESVDSDKENYLRFVLPLNTQFTRLAGDNTIKLSLIWNNEEDGRTYTIESSELVIPILPQNDYFAYMPADQLSSIDQRIASLQTETDKLAVMANDINTTMPTDLELNDQKLQLRSQEGKLLGDGVEISVGFSEVDGLRDGIVSLDDVTEDGSTSDPLARAVDLKLTEDTLQLLSETGKTIGNGVKILIIPNEGDLNPDGIVDIGDLPETSPLPSDDYNEPDGINDGLLDLGSI